MQNVTCGRFKMKRKYSKEPIFYVYALLDPRKPGAFRYGRWVFNYEPFYIGKGKGNRCLSHFDNSSSKKMSFKNSKIKKIRAETGSDPLLIYKKKNLTEKEAFDAEKTLIARVGRKDRKLGPLANLTDGGEGATGYVFTKKDKENVSKGLKESVHRAGRKEKIQETWRTKSREDVQKCVRAKQKTERKNRSLLTEAEREAKSKALGQAISRAKALKKSLKSPEQLELEREARSKRVKKQWESYGDEGLKKLRQKMSRVALRRIRQLKKLKETL